MASQNPCNGAPMEVTQPNPYVSITDPSSSSHSTLYPKFNTNQPTGNHFANNNPSAPPAPPESVEEVVLTVPGAILHLIDKQYSVELACGDLSIIRLRQGASVVAVLARVADDIQWPLAKDETAVKLDESHYFFSFRAPKESRSSDSSDDEDGKGLASGSDDLLNYGLTIVSKGQEDLLEELDKVLEHYSSFAVHRVSNKGKNLLVLDEALLKEISPADLKSEKKKELVKGRSSAYWTTLAPNVEDYSGTAAKMIASGSGQLIKGILWCGDVTVDGLKWGNEVLKKRMKPGSKPEISPETLKRIKRCIVWFYYSCRVKKVSKMTEKVATGVLSGAVKVSGFFTSSVANSKVGKKFFSLLPGEIVLASLDAFSNVCDAVEVAGKNIMSTSSNVTTELVSHRYGDEAAKATSEGLNAAGHAVGTAWAAVKIRKALNPKSVLKPTTLAKSAAKAAAAQMKSKSSK